MLPADSPGSGRIGSLPSLGGLVGHSPEMEELYSTIIRVASIHHPVLIEGETGTGKELVARAIHASGSFRDRPFIPVDCGALTATLIESELFGYAQGAFTGATHSQEGLLASADSGIVLLDEIGELPLNLQVKLLRALQEKEIRPVGSTRRVPIGVRILAATNRDLEAAVEQGMFRKDLYFRLNVFKLRISPLRERRQDIPLLVGHFLERLARSTATEKTLSDDALQWLMGHDWPGNVRELENLIERAWALSAGPVLRAADFATTLQGTKAPRVDVATDDALVPLAELEMQAILTALRHVRGNKPLAARLLGIGKTTLYRKLREYEARFAQSHRPKSGEGSEFD
ncbi:MAG: sigma-54 dependent transcriptional regulator [Acidobacteria bacterium]|nr:sigma-54 dependent transcriptional regulator [Acidobacteriota bacterium]